MANLKDYINNLKSDKSKMIEALRSRGEEVEDDATFTDLISNVSVVGGAKEYFSDNPYRTSTGQNYNIFSAFAKKIPQFNTKNMTDFSNAFSSFQISEIPLIDTSNGTRFYAMCYGCSELLSFPLLNTSNGTNFSSMFANCSKLESVELIDTSKSTDFSSMFHNCRKLKEIPLINTENGTNFNGMVSSCTALISLPLLNTSKGTNFSYMVADCSNLEYFPPIDTSKGTNFEGIFRSCVKLTTIPELDMSSARNIYLIFQSTGQTLINLGGFKNLGQNYTTTASTNNNQYTLNLSAHLNLTHESALNVLNGLYDIASKGCQPQKVRFHANVMALLSEDEVAIGTNKGWNVTT